MFIFVFLCLNWQVSQFEEFDLGEWPLHPPYHLIITMRIIIIMRKTMSMTIGMTGDVALVSAHLLRGVVATHC